LVVKLAALLKLGRSQPVFRWFLRERNYCAGVRGTFGTEGA
jgi:hypothetical protein